MQSEIENLNDSINYFIEIADRVELSKQVYENGWNAKKIIAHIVFYHEYYASVVKAMVNNQKLPLINKSLAKINPETANEYSRFSRSELLNRLKKAQKTLSENLLKLSDSAKIPYKENGRIYTAKDYAHVISRHVLKHAKDLKRNIKP